MSSQHFIIINIKAFIVDSVDFNNDKDENGRDKRDQPIGVWDYENIKCDIYASIKQVAKSKIKSDNMLKENHSYPIYNSDFKQSQKSFQIGLDFFIYTTSFKEL